MIYDEFIKKSGRLYYIFFLILGIGAAAGCVFYVNRYISEVNIKPYMDSCLLSANADVKTVASELIKDNIFIMLIMTVGSLFKPGIILITAQVIKQGFVTGFTSSAVFGAYGMKGIYAIISMFPQSVVAVPALMLLASVTSSVSMVKSAEKDKKFYLFYIFFLLAVFTIFCATSFLEGYLATIFMEKAVNVVT